MSDGRAETPARVLSVADVARRLGIEPRTVRRWCDPDGAYRGRVCPHDRSPARVGGNDKGEVIRLNFDEVRVWCDAQGVGKPKRLEDRERVENGPVEYTVTGEVVGPKKGPGDQGIKGSRDQAEHGLDPSIPRPPQSFDPSVSLPSIPSGDERAAVRAQIEALAGIVHEFQVTLANYQRDGRADRISTSNLQQAAAAATKLSGELRQLDAQDDERRRVRGELVARGVAERMIRTAVEGLITAHESLRQDIADELVRQGVQIPGLSDEAASRKIYAAIEPLFDKARHTVADELEAAAGGGGGAGGGSDTGDVVREAA